MNMQHRASSKAKLRLETLEDRITPVAIDSATSHAVAILAHTNVVVHTETGEHPSHSSVNKAVLVHRHEVMKPVTHHPKRHAKASSSPGLVAANPVTVIMIPVVDQSTVASPTNAAPSNSSGGGTTTSTNTNTGGAGSTDTNNPGGNNTGGAGSIEINNPDGISTLPAHIVVQFR